MLYNPTHENHRRQSASLVQFPWRAGMKTLSCRHMSLKKKKKKTTLFSASNIMVFERMSLVQTILAGAAKGSGSVSYVLRLIQWVKIVCVLISISNESNYGISFVLHRLGESCYVGAVLTPSQPHGIIVIMNVITVESAFHLYCSISIYSCNKSPVKGESYMSESAD